MSICLDSEDESIRLEWENKTLQSEITTLTRKNRELRSRVAELERGIAKILSDGNTALDMDEHATE